MNAKPAGRLSTTIPGKRALRPRPALAVAPLAVSTENCLALAGITPRKLRDLLAAHPDVPRSRVGHTLIVEPSAFYELLARLRVDAGDGEAIDLTHDDDDVPATVDGVLAKLGRERGAD